MSEGTHAETLHSTPSRGGGAARLTGERRGELIAWGGGVLALLVGILLFTRFSISGNLWRDEAIYAYGGQQLAGGEGFSPHGGPQTGAGRPRLPRHLRPEAAAADVPDGHRGHRRPGGGQGRAG